MRAAQLESHFDFGIGRCAVVGFRFLVGVAGEITAVGGNCLAVFSQFVTSNPSVNPIVWAFALNPIRLNRERERLRLALLIAIMPRL